MLKCRLGCIEFRLLVDLRRCASREEKAAYQDGSDPKHRFPLGRSPDQSWTVPQLEREASLSSEAALTARPQLRSLCE